MSIKIDRLKRSGRKTIAVLIEQDGSLEVRAPRRASLAQIEAFIAEKEHWILEKQALARCRYQALQPRQYLEGEEFLYLGRTYPLRILPAASKNLELRAAFYLSAAAQPHAREMFESWYRCQARQVLGERVAYFAAQHGFRPGKIRINSARTRWGSCGSKNDLNFPWRLVMAPLEVIDYVILHELVHLEIKNHSRAFWVRVATFCPEYRVRVAWLKRHGHTLMLETLKR